MNAANKGLLAAALLAAAMTAAPVMAMAGETAPLATTVQNATSEQGEKIGELGRERGYQGISMSNSWLNQARINGVLINLRLFGTDGESVTFQEKLNPIVKGQPYTTLELVASQWNEDLLLQLDQHALDVLRRVGVPKIVVADPQLYVRASYEVEELFAIREMFGLGSKEQLCLSGEENPVSVGSEDGVRRQMTK